MTSAWSRSFSLALAAIFVVVVPVRGLAQGVAVVNLEPEENEKTYMVYSGYNHMFESDIDTDGDVSRDSAQVQGQGTWQLTDNLSMTALGVYELNVYDFSNDFSDDFPDGRFRWGTTNQVTLGVMFQRKMNDNWSLIGAPVARYAAEVGADVDDSIIGGGIVGFLRHANPKLQWGVMIGVVSSIEDPISILPIPTVRWQFAEKWRYHLGITPLGGRNGIGTELTYSPSEKLDLTLGVQYTKRRYRLDNRGQEPSGDRINKKNGVGGVGEDSGLPIFAQLTWHPTESSSLEAFGGVIVGGNMRTESRTGNKIADTDLDPAPIVGFRGEIHF